MATPIRGICHEGSMLEDFYGRVALWSFGCGAAFDIYIYETDNRSVEDDWLLWKRKLNKREAIEIFKKVVSVLNTNRGPSLSLCDN